MPLLLFAFAVLLGGCAAKAPTGEESQARAVWRTFRETADAPWKPFSVQASLNFSVPGNSHRVVLKLYGQPNLPLRLDFTAGMGQTFAMWREDGSGWLAYYPLSAAAYTHPDTRRGAAILGIPLPFSLRELSAVVCGHFGEFVPREFASAKPKPGGLEYAVKGDPRLSTITLSLDGKPVALSGKGVEPWRVEFDDYENVGGRDLPRLITVTTPGGAKGILRIKKYEQREDNWPKSSLELKLPERTVVYDLDLIADFKRPDVGGGQ